MLMEALYSLIIVISIRLELSRVCSFVKSVLSLIFFKDIFLNIVVNIEEYITQMFYCKTWIFWGLDMNEWLKPGKFPLRADQQRIFLHQKGCNFYPPTFSWALFLTAENEQWHSSHGKESRKGGVDLSSSSAWTSIPHSSETTRRQAPLVCCQQTQSSAGLYAAPSKSICPPFLPGSTRHFIQGQELPAAVKVGVPSAFACAAISRVPDPASDLMHRQLEKVQMTELPALDLSSSNLAPLNQASRLLNLSITGWVTVQNWIVLLHPNTKVISRAVNGNIAWDAIHDYLCARALEYHQYIEIKY